MDRSECFQMFVYLLCSHYKTFTLALELFPLLYVLGGGGGGLKDLMEVCGGSRGAHYPNNCLTNARGPVGAVRGRKKALIF